VKYDINSDSIISIPQFILGKLYACQLFSLTISDLQISIIDLHLIEENSPEFKLNIDDILCRIKNMGSVVNSNEAMRCEYILTILYTAVNLLKDLLILPQMTVTDIESSDHVDYAIKKIIDGLFEEIICITERK